MIELYSNQPNVLKYYFSVEGVPTTAEDVTITVSTSNDRTSFGLPTVIKDNTIEMGEVEYTIPTSVISNHQYARIDISYRLEDHGMMSEELLLPVVKRYVTFEEAKKALSDEELDSELTWDEFVELERLVRQIIDSYCMQSFNSWRGTRTVYAMGGRISLPQHLDALEELTVVNSPYLATTLNPFHGFALTDPGMSLVNEDQIQTVSMFRGTPRRITYRISGLWGYTSIPGAIRQAAIILMKDQLCPDKMYRERFIDNFRNENIRLEMRDEAFSGDTTGNAVVDDILSPYKSLYIEAV